MLLVISTVFVWSQPGLTQDSAAPDESQLQQDLKRVIDRARDAVFPALVNIEVVTTQYYGGKESKYQSVGSGVIISPEGLVVTNYHVTRNGRRFRCTLADKREAHATLVGDDPLTDLALLRLAREELGSGADTLPYATFGDSSAVTPGDFVIAMGSPFALSRSITLGIVSNTERVFTEWSGTDPEELEIEEGERSGLFTRWIQHDATIWPGNSGGPLVNLSGQVVGINELGGGASFAIPSNLAQAVVAELQQRGEVLRSWIAINVKPLQRTGLDQGVLINSVGENGPAEKAGLEPGDRILRMNGEDVTVRFPEEVPVFLRRIADFPIGTEIVFDYLRNGEARQARVVTGRFLRDRGDERAFRGWGLTAEEITPALAQAHRLESTAGVLVTGVKTGSPAAEAKPGLFEGDVILRVGDRDVATLDVFRTLYDEIMGRADKPEWLVVEFVRERKAMVTALKPRPDELPQPPRELPTAWLGVETQPVYPDLAKQIGYGETTGFRITRIYENTTAGRSDLRVGDLVIAVNETTLAARNPQDQALFQRAVRRLPLGGTAQLRVVRHGEIRDVTLALERSRESASEVRRWRDADFEFEVREITFYDRADNHWSDSVMGAVVSSVENAGWAGLAGLRSGDLLQRVNGIPITGVESLRGTMDEIRKTRPDRVVFFVQRATQTRLLFAEPEWLASAEP